MSFESVTDPKPAPEPYLVAAKGLGINANYCLAFEDTDVGARSALEAGMTVVQVPDLMPSDGRFAHFLAPDLIVGARRAGLVG